MTSGPSSSMRRWPYWLRAFLLGLLVAGQGRLILHHHVSAPDLSIRSAVSAPPASSPADEAHCPTCKLSTQTRLADLSAPVLAPVPERVEALAVPAFVFFAVPSSIRLSARAPPASEPSHPSFA